VPAAQAAPALVLVVDDEENLRLLLRLILERAGHEVVEATNGEEALEQLAAQPRTCAVLCDIRMPRMGGLEFLDALRDGPAARREAVDVVMMSAYATTDLAVEALGRGAVDFISKPFKADEITHCIDRLVGARRLAEENRRLRAQVTGRGAGPAELGGFVGASPAAREVMELVERAAAYPSTVLITGESGTGKELLARVLHDRSRRSGGPFVPVNCAAIPENLLESELFGHERGAFTGADRARAGLFEAAHGGTLLLDEIGDMPTALQTRLLRVLEDGRVRRVGGRSDRQVDVRVVAATAQDLDQHVQDGRFRSDLFYRLNVVRVRVPPLRERLEDLPLLVRVLCDRICARLGRPPVSHGPELLARLASHDWPGNVRELENVLERAILVTASPKLEPAQLSIGVEHSAAPATGVVSLGPDDGDSSLSIKQHTAELERHLITLALTRTGGNRTQAARLLELSTKALAYKIRDYGVET
jgi:two-component system response regulator AtoC